MRVGGSDVVVLPKDWLQGMELKTGDAVELIYDQDVRVRSVKRHDLER
jgi:antitoxin component of MazEF toxin-antitoxin module